MPNAATPRPPGQHLLNRGIAGWADPGSRAALTLLASLSFLLILTLFVVAQNTASSRPVLGIRVEPCVKAPLCIAWVVPASNGWDRNLRVGDPVLRILDPADGAGPLRAIQIPDSAGPRAVVAPLTSLTGASRWALPIVGLIYGAIGALVLWRRPDLSAAWAFWLSTLSVAGAAVLQPASSASAPWALPIQFMLIVLIPWALWRFLTSLVPGKRPSYQRLDRAAILLGVLIVAVYSLVFVFSPNRDALPRMLASLYFITLVLASLAFLGIGLFRGTPTERASVRDMAIATFVGFAPLIFLVFIPIAVRGHGRIQPEAAALALVAIPFGFVYSVFRHQILGIRRLVNRGIVYILLGLLLFGLTMAALYGISRAWPQAVILENNEIWVVALLVAAASFSIVFLYRPAQRLADSYLYRDTYDYASTLSGFTRQLSGTATAYDVVTGMLLNLSQTMNVDGFLLQHAGEAGGRGAYSGGRAAGKLLVASQNADFTPGPILSARYLSGEPVLAVSLEEDWRLWIGPKAGGESFRAEDIRLVEAVANLVSILLGRIRQNEELRELNGRLVSAQEEERARLSHEIHDGPLQVISVITRLPNQSEQVIKIAREAAQELRAISTALRPPILDLFGLIPAVEWLADQQDLDVTIEHTGFSDETRLPNEVELALFRCIQESLTNVTKHAQATAVHIKLEQNLSEVVVSIVDNGVGFAQKRRAEAAAGGHLGLVGMRERLVHLSGTFTVESTPGKGTTVRLRIPMANVSKQPAPAL